MSYTEMSLPIDIPWKRLAVSEDMIAGLNADGQPLDYPEMWRSSIAVFYHEPPVEDLPPDYCNRKITYLKIVCTITNYQLPNIALVNALPDQRFSDIQRNDILTLEVLRNRLRPLPLWEIFDARVTDSYPCYGALVQVSVYPHPAKDAQGDNVYKHDYPYIEDFQPRKREMYEVITETGEVGSQSGYKLNVNKGTTNTDTLETYDVNTQRGSKGLNLGILGEWGDRPWTGQWGIVDRSQNVNQLVTSTDASRDKRENYSFSTNINQLYSLLQGYHIGTNRALFFLQPRPHIKDTKFTFIRGLRRLEGIQEFFLIVNRPASVPGMCVDVDLERAHVFAERAYRPRIIPYSQMSDPKNLAKTAEAIQADETDLRSLFHDEYKMLDKWNECDAWERSTAVHYDEIGWPQIDAWVKEKQFSWAEWGLLYEMTQRYPDIGVQEAGIIFDEYEADSGHFFVVKRRLRSCFIPPIGEGSDPTNVSTIDYGESVVMDVPFVLGETNVSPASPSLGAGTLASNSLTYQLNNALISSIGSPSRLIEGQRSFLETEFMLDEMASLLRTFGEVGIHGTDEELNRVEGIIPFLEKGLGRLTRITKVKDLGKIHTSQIAIEFNIRDQRAREVRRDLLVQALGSLEAPIEEDAIKPINPIIFRTFLRQRTLKDKFRPKEINKPD